MSDDSSLTITDIQEGHIKTFVCKVNLNLVTISTSSIRLLKLTGKSKNKVT